MNEIGYCRNVIIREKKLKTFYLYHLHAQTQFFRFTYRFWFHKFFIIKSITIEFYFRNCTKKNQYFTWFVEIVLFLYVRDEPRKYKF